MYLLHLLKRVTKFEKKSILYECDLYKKEDGDLPYIKAFVNGCACVLR